METKNKNDIKEILEVLLFVESAGVKLVKAAKDGIGFEDIGLIMDMDLLGKGKAAVEGVHDIPSEILDLDWSEGGELAQRSIKLAQAIVSALAAGK